MMPSTKARCPATPEPASTPVQLVFVEREALTIRRRRCGTGWRYIDGDGRTIRDTAERERLGAIGVPPAYSDARFCPDPCGHLQAVARDARGRWQYRYHAAFRDAQESQKFAGCAAFGAALPAMRRRLRRDLQANPASRTAVLAAIVRILDCAYLRIGNEAYARANKSYGVTTLRNRHARVSRSALSLRYRGKSGIVRDVRLTDRSVIRIVRRCQDLPGQQLFQFKTSQGDVQGVSSADVNAYLRDLTGEAFTAKSFRTWHGSVIAFAALNRGASLKEMLAEVSDALANTPAVARRSYVHQALVSAAQDGTFAPRALPRPGLLSAAERGFLDWLAEQDRQPEQAMAGGVLPGS